MGLYRKDYSDVIFYCGPGVLNTAANGLKTLYVIGWRSVQQMVEVAKFNECKAIHLGAENSFQNNKLWAKVLPELLETGLKITLEYPASSHDFLLEVLNSSIWNNNNFVPLMVCKVKHIETISKNFTVKLDDDTFNETNRGVWTLPVDQLVDSNRFTGWGEYENEEVLLRETGKKSNKKPSQ